MARSTTEAEYISLSDASCELLWLQSLFRSLHYNDIFYVPAELWCDNQSAIALASTRKFTKSSKHIDVKYNHVRDLKENNIIDVLHIRTGNNLADGLTKPLPRVKLEYLINHSLNIDCINPR